MISRAFTRQRCNGNRLRARCCRAGASVYACDHALAAYLLPSTLPFAQPRPVNFLYKTLRGRRGTWRDSHMLGKVLPTFCVTGAILVILLQGFQTMPCIFGGRRGALDVSILLLRGRRGTSDLPELRQAVTTCKLRGRCVTS